MPSGWLSGFLQMPAVLQHHRRTPAPYNYLFQPACRLPEAGSPVPLQLCCPSALSEADSLHLEADSPVPPELHLPQARIFLGKSVPQLPPVCLPMLLFVWQWHQPSKQPHQAEHCSLPDYHKCHSFSFPTPSGSLQALPQPALFVSYRS